MILRHFWPASTAFAYDNIIPPRQVILQEKFQNFSRQVILQEKFQNFLVFFSPEKGEIPPFDYTQGKLTWERVDPGFVNPRKLTLGISATLRLVVRIADLQSAAAQIYFNVDARETRKQFQNSHLRNVRYEKGFKTNCAGRCSCRFYCGRL
jgi:hypothetical protein